MSSTDERKLVKVDKHPGIYRRGNRYIGVYRANGRQAKAFGATIAEVKDKIAEARTDIRRGEFRELSRATVAVYAAEWIETYAGRTRRGLGEVTRDDYRSALNREIIPALGNHRLAEIEPRDVKALAKRLSDRGLAPASVAKILAPLKAMLATAHEEGAIRSNPTAGLRYAQPVAEGVEEVERAKALTEEELSTLLGKLDPTWQPFFEFLYETSLRIGEAIEARWKDVSFGDKPSLNVHRRYYRGKVGLPKGRKKRTIRLSTSLSQTLWARQKDTHPDDLLFTSALGQRIDPSNLMARELKPAAVAAGLGEWTRNDKGEQVAESWVGFHTFRHTGATMLFRRGWNAAQVQKYLGHSDPGFTLRTYVHLLDEDLPEPDFRGNGGATQATETARTEEPELAAVSAI